MVNWLERAKCEISQDITQNTAVADERIETAVTAVQQTDKPENAQASIDSIGSTQATITKNEEAVINAWLGHIEETDPAVIDSVLNDCRINAKIRNWFLVQAAEEPKPVMWPDDRRCCNQCANLTQRGLCLAAWRGEINASRNYEPICDLLMRCGCYEPKASHYGHQSGRER